METQFIRWLTRRGRLTVVDLVRAAFILGSRLPTMRRQGYMVYHEYLRGRRVADVASWCGECLDEAIIPRLSPAARTRIAEHRAAGHLVVMLSGSIEPLVSRLGEHLQVDLSISSRLETVGDRYTGRLYGRQVAGAQKAVMVRHLAAERDVDLGQSYCYADHHSDVEMLELFGNPRPTNPNRRLRAISADRGWKVERFARGPVASRLPV